METAAAKKNNKFEIFLQQNIKLIRMYLSEDIIIATVNTQQMTDAYRQQGFIPMETAAAKKNNKFEIFLQQNIKLIRMYLSEDIIIATVNTQQMTDAYRQQGFIPMETVAAKKIINLIFLQHYIEIFRMYSSETILQHRVDKTINSPSGQDKHWT